MRRRSQTSGFRESLRPAAAKDRDRNVSRCERESTGRLDRVAGDVGCEHDIRRGQYRIVGRRRLDLEDIERRPADPPLPQGFRKRPLVDQRSPRGVDQDRRRLHGAKPLPVDDVEGFPGQRQVQGDDVRRSQQRLQPLDLLRPALLDGSFGKRWVVGEHAHSEPARTDPRHARPDIANSDESERSIEKLLELQLPPRRIAPAGDHRVHVRHAAESREHHCHGRLGDGIRVAARNVRDDDATRGRRRDVDIVDAGSMFGDDAQPRQGIDQSGVDRDVPDDDSVRHRKGPLPFVFVLMQRGIDDEMLC